MEINWSKLALLVLLVAIFSELGECLECYACSNQDSNQDKCIKTSKQCEEHHEVCMTTVAWGLPPYWTPYGDRMHYVWKDCATWKDCADQKAANNRFCKRDWYDDWSCIDCCSGDLCNYYVTLGASSLQLNGLVVYASLLFILLARYIW